MHNKALRLNLPPIILNDYIVEFINLYLIIINEIRKIELFNIWVCDFNFTCTR